MGYPESSWYPKWIVFILWQNPIKMDDEQGYPYFRQPPNITINRPLTLMILPLTSAISKKWQFSTAQSQSIKQYPNTVEQQKATWCWLHFKKKIRVLLGRFLGVFQQSPQDSHFMGQKEHMGSAKCTKNQTHLTSVRHPSCRRGLCA